MSTGVNRADVRAARLVDLLRGFAASRIVRSTHLKKESGIEKVVPRLLAAG